MCFSWLPGPRVAGVGVGELVAKGTHANIVSGPTGHLALGLYARTCKDYERFPRNIGSREGKKSFEALLSVIVDMYAFP